MSTLKERLKQAEQLQNKRSFWNPMYQLIGEYFFQRKATFLLKREDGAFLDDGQITDSTGTLALTTMASALLGLLWPSGGRSIRAVAPYFISDKDENKKYFEYFTKQLTNFLDRPKARMLPVLGEYMLEEGAFGTTGIGVFEEDDYSDPLLFKAFSLTGLYIREGKNSEVDIVVYAEEVEYARLVADYGEENVHPTIRKAYKATPDAKVTIVTTLMPRTEAERKGKKGMLGMPYALYVDDKSNNYEVFEGGYTEMCIRVPRFNKLPDETQGRSPAMNALPTQMEACRVAEAYRVGVEKKAEPPLMVLNDGSLGPEEIDTSAGAINVFNITNRIQSSLPPVSPVMDVGELQSTTQYLGELRQQILGHFLIDRLLDLNNKTRMTYGEAQIRLGIRNDSLNTILARQKAECFVPLIERAVAILFEKGLLGVVQGSKQEKALLERGITPYYVPPEVLAAIAAGMDFYDIVFISPAERMLRNEEVEGLTAIMNQAIARMAVDPEAMDLIDGDNYTKLLSDILNVNPMVLRAQDKVDELRVSRAQQRQRMMDAEMQAQQASSAQSTGQAMASVASANKLKAEAAA